MLELPLGAPLPEVEIDPDQDATILYTSGTTGFPKGAVSTHRAVASALSAFACSALVHALRFPKEGPAAATHPTSFILIVPLFHVTGAIAVMMSCFAAGYKLVMMYKWDPARALELIQRAVLGKRRRWRRSLTKDVERRASDAPAAQRVDECRLVDDGAARRVDEVRARAHPTERRRVHEPLGVRVEGAVDRDEVGAREQLFERHDLDAVGPHARRRARHV